MCRGALNDTCLDDGLMVVMVSRSTAEASFGILNSMMPNLLDVANEW